jgi:hypothetical protein
MLSSSMVKEEVELVIDSIVSSKLEDARQRLGHLAPQVSSEYGRGALLALNGIINVIENKTPDKMSGREKILRVVERIPKIQRVDDLDKGYLQTIGKWAKKIKESAN